MRGKLAYQTDRALTRAVVVTLGLVLGLGLFTFEMGKGRSYFVDRPEACANCHVMRETLARWERSSHRRHATCNGCHMPEGLVAGWGSKALNGLLHGYAFTTGRFREPIRAKDFNQRIAHSNCVRCHARLFPDEAHARALADEARCVHCHGNVGHPSSN